MGRSPQTWAYEIFHSSGNDDFDPWLARWTQPTRLSPDLLQRGHLEYPHQTAHAVGFSQVCGNPLWERSKAANSVSVPQPCASTRTTAMGIVMPPSPHWKGSWEHQPVSYRSKLDSPSDPRSQSSVPGPNTWAHGQLKGVRRAAECQRALWSHRSWPDV